MKFPNHAFAIKITVGSRKLFSATYQELRLSTNTEVPTYPIKFVLVFKLGNCEFIARFKVLVSVITNPFEYYTMLV